MAIGVGIIGITVRLTFLLLITVGFNRRIELTKIRALAQYF